MYRRLIFDSCIVQPICCAWPVMDWWHCHLCNSLRLVWHMTRLSLAFHAPSLQLLAEILSCIRESFSDLDVANNNNNYNDTIDHNRTYILIVWNERLNHESPEKIKNYHILWTRSSVCSYIYPIRSTYPSPRPTPWSEMNYVTTTITQDKPHIW